MLAALELTGSGLRCEGLRVNPGVHVSAALGFVLVEFLTVLGNLTAEILTPALHEVLSHESGLTQDEVP